MVRLSRARKEKEPEPARRVEFFIEEALKQAQKAEKKGEVPVGAVVVYQGKIISKAFNQREKKNSPLGHAEIEALLKASKQLKSWRLNECELYVTLEPCLMCVGALWQSRIGKVFYGAKDPKGGALSLGYRIHEDLRLNHRFEMVYVSNTECGKILSQFFHHRRRL